MTREVPHPIRLNILSQLKISDATLRYSQMKPNELDSDLFNYHLQYLVKQKLITKASTTYELSEEGKKFLVELFPLSKDGETNQFKVASLCIIWRKTKHGIELLYQHRGRSPFKNDLEMIAGGLSRGEFALTAAKRRAREEAGVSTQFKLMGTPQDTLQHHWQVI